MASSYLELPCRTEAEMRAMSQTDEKRTCEGGVEITGRPCPKCGAGESDLCGQINGTTYLDGLKIVSLQAERDKLRQTVIDGEKRCIELLQERDRLLAANAELLTALEALLHETELAGNANANDYGWPTVVPQARAALQAHGPTKEAAS